MKRVSIKFFIFDVGSVILLADDNQTYSKLQSYGVSSKKANKYYSGPEYLDYSRGKISSKEFAKIVSIKSVRFPLTYGQIKAAHDNHLIGIDWDVISIIKKIPSNKLVILTDTNVWQTEKEESWVNLKKYAFKVFRSHQIGMLKTDKELFPYIIRALGVEANELLLIDDSPEKIKMAQQFNLQTHLYKNSRLLKNFLSTLNS